MAFHINTMKVINIIKKILCSIKNKNTTPMSKMYDEYWRQHGNSWVYGINIIDDCIKSFKFESILDAGCGSGDVVNYMNNKGFYCVGVDISLQGAKQKFPELVTKEIIQQSELSKLPFPDKSFDVVFCSEVLEHIPADEISDTIAELCRVAKKHVFCTISLRPSSNNNKYHITLRSRKWWEDHFQQQSMTRRSDLINPLQVKEEGLSNREVLERGPTKSIMNELDWFLNENPYELNGEIEPWYFIYDCKIHN